MPFTRPPGVGDTTQGASVRAASPVVARVLFLASLLASVATAGPQGEERAAALAREVVHAAREESGTR